MWDSQRGIDVVYIRDTKKLGLFSPSLDHFRKDWMNTFPGFLFESNHAEFLKAHPPQVWIVIVKRGFLLDGFVPTLAYFDAASSVTRNLTSVAVPVLRRGFAFDQLGPPAKQQNHFVLSSEKNGAN